MGRADHQISHIPQCSKNAITIYDKNGVLIPDPNRPYSVLQKGLRICTGAACKLNEFAETYPTLARYSVTVLQLALGGPISYVRDMALDYSGVQGQVDTVVESGKGWVSKRLQSNGMETGYANLLTEGGGFGLTVGLSVVGGASKDKILESAGDVVTTAKKMMRGEPKKPSFFVHLNESSLKTKSSVSIKTDKIQRSSMVKLVNGRKPVNSDYAGLNFPREKLPKKPREKYNHEIPFTLSGHPDFSRYSINKVQINVTGKSSVDFSLADKVAGFKKRPEGYTWHHHHDTNTMLLIPTDLHEAVRHMGGVAIKKHMRKNK